MSQNPTFLDIGHVIPDAKWHNLKYVHAFHEIIVIIRGKMHVYGASGEEMILQAGDAALYPAGCIHKEFSDPSDPVESYFIAFDAPSLCEKEIMVNREHHALLRSLFVTLWEEAILSRALPFYGEYITLLLKIFCTQSMERTPKSSMVQMTDQFLKRNYFQHLTLDEIASNAGKSKYHFLRLYREETGRTPFQTLREIRLQEAISLLKYTEMSIKEIAYRVGFADGSHFSHAFMKYIGRQPGEYRVNNLK